MQGFDEFRTPEDMICKLIKKDEKYLQDDYENIADIHAFTTMFPMHKHSKFGSRLT